MVDLLNKFRSSVNLQDKKLSKQIIIFIISSALLILFLDFSFIIKPQLNGIMTIGPEIINKKGDLDNLLKDLSLMEDSKKGLIKNKEQEGTAKFKQIISEDGLPLLLKEIADLAKKNKVKIMQMNTVNDAKAKEEVIAGGKFLPFIITLNLSCNYHSLGSFINALENMETFMSVEEMEISRDPKDYLQQKAELVLKTYAKK